MNLNGRWTGKLIYGNSFGPLEHEALFFTLDLEQKGDEITGTLRDVDGIGLSPYEHKIKGFVDGTLINFVKAYQSPVLFEEPVGSEATEPRPDTEVSFSGTYDAATGEYEGEWIIVSGYILYGDVFFESDNGGTWRMRRDT